MAKLQLQAGTTSKTVKVFIQNNSVTTGAGLTGLLFNTAGLTSYYVREGASSSTSISLVTATLGTWTSSGFIVVDGTNMPGLYELGIPNAAIASGASSVVIYLQGATNMAPLVLEIELTAVNNQSTGFGLVNASANVAQINSSSTSAVNLSLTTQSIVTATVGSSSTTTSIVTSSMTPAAVVTGQFIGRVVNFNDSTTTTNLRGQSTVITASTSGGVLTVNALTTAPVSGDTFTIT